MSDDKSCLLKGCGKYPPTHSCVLFVVESFRSIGIVESDAFVWRSDVGPLTHTHIHSSTHPDASIDYLPATLTTLRTHTLLSLLSFFLLCVCVMSIPVVVPPSSRTRRLSQSKEDPEDAVFEIEDFTCATPFEK